MIKFFNFLIFLLPILTVSKVFANSLQYNSCIILFSLQTEDPYEHFDRLQSDVTESLNSTLLITTKNREIISLQEELLNKLSLIQIELNKIQDSILENNSTNPIESLSSIETQLKIVNHQINTLKNGGIDYSYSSDPKLDGTLTEETNSNQILKSLADDPSIFIANQPYPVEFQGKTNVSEIIFSHDLVHEISNLTREEKKNLGRLTFEIRKGFHPTNSKDTGAIKLYNEKNRDYFEVRKIANNFPYRFFGFTIGNTFYIEIFSKSSNHSQNYINIKVSQLDLRYYKKLNP